MFNRSNRDAFSGFRIYRETLSRFVRRFIGEAGSGSSGLILARSDVSQIKRVYYEMSPDEGDKFVRAIKENTQIRMNLKK
ncbi:conjugal transfer protein TraP [Klebsiella pneumoniae]